MHKPKYVTEQIGPDSHLDFKDKSNTIQCYDMPQCSNSVKITFGRPAREQTGQTGHSDPW